MTTPSSQIYYAAQQMLLQLGVQPTNNSINLLAAWIIEENGWTSTLPCYNPMNTTLKEMGSWSINSVNVQCYPNWSTGITANVDTLTSWYPTLTQAVKTGSITLFVGATAELSKWSGGSTGYGQKIESIYYSLPAPPYKYLSGTPVSTGGYTGISTSNPIVSKLSAPAVLIGDLIVFASGVGIAWAAIKILNERRNKKNVNV